MSAQAEASGPTFSPVVAETSDSGEFAEELTVTF